MLNSKQKRGWPEMFETLEEFAVPLGRRERIELADTPIYAEVLADRDGGEWYVVDQGYPERKRRWWWFW